jgi:PadR family transcriptional regulator, regulatory protein PadR
MRSITNSIRALLPPWHQFTSLLKYLIDSLRQYYYNVVIMKTDRTLGGFESMLMLTVLRLGEQAYGVTIRRELLTKAKKDVAIGAIYTALERLERKRFVESWLGEPTSARGGRAKRYYRLTARGSKVLNETQRAIQGLMVGLSLSGGNADA